MCGQAKPSAQGYLLFGDTLLDHNPSFEIELAPDTLGHSSLAVTSRYTHARPDESSARYLAV